MNDSKRDFAKCHINDNEVNNGEITSNKYRAEWVMTAIPEKGVRTTMLRRISFQTLLTNVNVNNRAT